MSTAFVTALDEAPNWIINILQQNQDRFALFFYDKTGNNYINTIIGAGEQFPIKNEENTDLTWRLLRYVEFGVPTQCFVCQDYKDKGFTFHQAEMIHFLCIGCIQGN